MGTLSSLWAKLMGRFAPDPIDDELAEHFELLRLERLQAGDTPAEAERFARHRLGHAPAIREQVRGLRLRHQLEAAVRDLRFAIRSFGRHGGAYGLATVILSLGIGISVALFSLVDAVVFAPLPYPEQDRVHLIWKSDPAHQSHLVGELAYPELADLQSNLPDVAFAALFPAAPYGNGRTLEPSSGDPVQIEACPASPDFFNALGVQPALGRGFAPADSAPGAAPVVVLSDWVWRRHFGARRDVLNRPVRINGRGTTVIGIMPPEFDFPRGVGLWMNLAGGDKRSAIWLQAVVRLRPGVPPERLQAAADQTFQVQAGDHPKQYSPTQRAVVTPIQDFFTGSSKTQLLLSLAASTLLLLSACISAGNLFLSRTLSRRQELATRTALGATPGQLVRQFLVESLLSAGIAVVAGGALAALLIRLLTAAAPADIPRIENAVINLPALGFAVFAALVATCACVLGPVLLLRLPRGERVLAGVAGSSQRSAGSRAATRLQRTFLLAQSALTVAILMASAMLFVSYRELLRTELGLANRDALSVNLALRGPEITRESYRKIYLDVIDRLRANAAVTNAAGILLRPLEGPIGWDSAYTFEFEAGQRDPTAVLPKANFEVVTPGYFDTVGTPLLAGRDFNAYDLPESEKVMVISDSIARRFRQANRDPLGQRMGVFGELRRVVGVVADARFRGVRQPGEDIYVPDRQIDIPTNYLIVRGKVPAAELLALVRRAVKEVAPAQAIAGEATIGELIDRNTARDRFNLSLLLLFAAGAIVLAAAGVHSVTRESVAVRAKEIAIRIAIGADRSRLAAQTAREVVLSVMAGALAGAVASVRFASAAEELLYSVSAREPWTLAGVTGFVVLVAAISAFVPAWRAAGRDPREMLLSD